MLSDTQWWLVVTWVVLVGWGAADSASSGSNDGSGGGGRETGAKVATGREMQLQRPLLPLWKQCVRDIGMYFIPSSPTSYRWKRNNPCGYSNMTWQQVRESVFFRGEQEKKIKELRDSPSRGNSTSSSALTKKKTMKKRVVGFAGDSTSLRAYLYAANTFLPPLNVPWIVKVDGIPDTLQETVRFGTKRNTSSRSDDDGGGSGTPTGGHDSGTKNLPPVSSSAESNIVYYKMRYVSGAERVVKQACGNFRRNLEEEGNESSSSSSISDVMVFTMGNWDLNWKLQRNTPMPGLEGGVHNLTAATEYWTKYIRIMMETILEECIKMIPEVEKRPIIIFREQFLPNCNSPRFLSKKKAYRRCRPLLRPIVVPLYRRVLSAMAWSLNIPVIPMDHVFKENFKYCGIGDGLHLERDCMTVEQEHLWNVVRMLRKYPKSARPSIPNEMKSNESSVDVVGRKGFSFPHPKQFIAAEFYEQWMISRGLLLAKPRTNMTTTTTRSSVSTVKTSEGGGDGNAASTDGRGGGEMPHGNGVSKSTESGGEAGSDRTLPVEILKQGDPSVGVKQGSSSPEGQLMEQEENTTEVKQGATASRPKASSIFGTFVFSWRDGGYAMIGLVLLSSILSVLVYRDDQNLCQTRA